MLKKKILLGLSVLQLAAFAAGCAKTKIEPLPDNAFVLDTIVTITLYDKTEQSILDGAFSLCEEYEQLLSRTIADSDVGRINAANGEPVTVDPRTAELIRTALQVSSLCDGGFDITIEPVSSLWNFKTEAPSLPDPEAIQKGIALVDYRQVKLEGDTVTLPAGMGIDLGAIAKGYIADQIADYLREQGVGKAIIDLGGNIYALGDRVDGTPWRVGIQSPFKERGHDYVGIVRVTDKSVVTSGIYERYFELDGQLYHHLLDTKTGYPMDKGLASVTIISDLSVDGDALSTAVFSLGVEKGLELVSTLDGVEAVFIDTDGNVTTSPGVTLEPVE